MNKPLCAKLYAAEPPDREQLARFSAFLRKKYGEETQLEFIKSAAYPGGFRLEVGDEVYDAFSRAGFRMERLALHKMELTDEGECYFRWHISLQEAVVSDLAGMGVPEEQIERCPVCSYADHRCYSVRRQGPQTGRNLSGIRLV